MTSDDRYTWDLIHEVIDVLERHGYRRSDSEHTAQAIGLIHHVAGIYEGALDAPRRYVEVPSSPLTAPQLPRPAVAVSADQAKTPLAALDDAAEYKRDRAEICGDCAGQSCTSCQWRMQTAGADDQLAEHMTQAAKASATRPGAPGHPASGTGGPHPAEKEAGQ
jgi:hypothetical protein